VYVQAQQRGRVAECLHRPWKLPGRVRQRRRGVKNRGKTCTWGQVYIVDHWIGEGKELGVSDSPEVPEWVAKIVADFALREGIEADQVVRLLIIQGALAYEKAYREESFEDR
jgi:hypothetical protein